MYTRDVLLDIHDRCHDSVRRLIEHCRCLSSEEFNRETPGFGYPTVRLQIHHVVGAQKYWLSVIQDRMNADENDADFPTIDLLQAFREEIYAATRSYLQGASQEELSSRREMLVWGGQRPAIVPAHAILRTQLHTFQHMGQVTAMCRLFGKPAPPGLDFSLK